MRACFSVLTVVVVVAAVIVVVSASSQTWRIEAAGVSRITHATFIIHSVW